MKAKEFVKIHYTDARIKKERLPANREEDDVILYRVVIGRSIDVGSGKSESAAWSDAKTGILKMFKKKKK